MRAHAEAADIPTHRDRQPVDEAHCEPSAHKGVEPILTAVDVEDVFDRNAAVEVDIAPAGEDPGVVDVGCDVYI